MTGVWTIRVTVPVQLCYPEDVATKNLTLTLPADVVRRAKVAAALRDTSVSALVADYLRELAEDTEAYDQAWHDEQQLMREGLDMRVGSISWTRDEVHER